MKRRIASRMSTTVLAFLIVAGLLVIGPSPAFAPTAVEYAVGPFPVQEGQTVRVAVFNVSNRPSLVVIAFVDLDGNLVAGGFKSETIPPRKGTTVDFTKEGSGNNILIGLLRTTSHSNAARGDLLPGATLHITDGTSILSINNFIGTDVTGALTLGG